MDLYTVVAAAAELNESAIGYRITSQCHDVDNQYGVNLNPNKSKRVSFSEDDMIIVLSED